MLFFSDRLNTFVYTMLQQLRNKYLHMVMNNLDSEVKELSAATVDTMKQCMAKVSYVVAVCCPFF